MAETIRVTGLREAQTKLYKFSQELGDFVVYKSLRAGANIIRDAARQKAPEGNKKRLKRGIVVFKSKIHKGKMSGDMIGLYLTIKSKEKTDPFYGRFQEEGWNTRGKSNALRSNFVTKYLFTRRSIGSSRVTQPGKTNVPGRRFIDQAFIEKRAAAVDMIARTAIASADLLAKKLEL